VLELEERKGAATTIVRLGNDNWKRGGVTISLRTDFDEIERRGKEEGKGGQPFP